MNGGGENKHWFTLDNSTMWSIHDIQIENSCKCLQKANKNIEIKKKKPSMFVLPTVKVRFCCNTGYSQKKQHFSDILLSSSMFQISSSHLFWFLCLPFFLVIANFFYLCNFSQFKEQVALLDSSTDTGTVVPGWQERVGLFLLLKSAVRFTLSVLPRNQKSLSPLPSNVFAF